MWLGSYLCLLIFLSDSTALSWNFRQQMPCGDFKYGSVKCPILMYFQIIFNNYREENKPSGNWFT